VRTDSGFSPWLGEVSARVFTVSAPQSDAHTIRPEPAHELCRPNAAARAVFWCGTHRRSPSRLLVATVAASVNNHPASNPRFDKYLVLPVCAPAPGLW